MDPKRILIETAGWYGAAAVLSAYALNSFGFIAAHGVAYQALNASGALGIVLVSWSRKAYQPLALNAVWAAVGVIALLNAIMRV